MYVNSSLNFIILLLSIISLSFLMFYQINYVYAQTDTTSIKEKFDVIKTNNSERFVFPYDSSNLDRKNPLVYSYDTAKDVNWILTMENNLTYSNSSEAKTIIKFMEPKPSEKFIELAMFELNDKFWVAVNTNESGYIRVHERDDNGWSRDEPIIVSHANNQGLTITNGKRIIIDKLSLDGFSLGSVAVYGKDDIDSPVNTIDGDISFNLIYGDPKDSPLYYVPIIMLASVGGIVLVLLKMKKRDPETD